MSSQSSEDRVISCQKYFIFKIQDLVNNSFHTLEEKRMESLLQYMHTCINTYEELRASLDQSKLKCSYEALLEGLIYQVKYHPFRKLELYRDDFSYLSKLVGKCAEVGDNEIHNIHRCIVALKKKLEAENLWECYIQCLLVEQSFGGMDLLMEALVSDLLYKGNSMARLREFFKVQQTLFLEENDTKQVINNIREFDREKVEFLIHIQFKISSDTQKEAALDLLGKQFEIVLGKDSEIPDNYTQNDTYVASKNYSAWDEMRAIDLARREFESVKQLFDLWQGTKNCIKDDLWYFWESKDGIKRISLKSIDDTKMLSYIDNNYKKQMERFLQLRTEIGNENTQTLERVLYTLNEAKMLTNQNRLLNFWSSLEYILHPFPRFTIIEKARVIVPEVFGLFYLKNKLNIFWSRLVYVIAKKGYAEKYSAMNQFYIDCKEEKDYDTFKVISYLCREDKYQAFLEEISVHAVLERECRELIMLFTEPVKAYKAIQEYYEGIRHDLNYIYRLRNQLIHSAKAADESLEYISFRLYRYVNSVLSTILYYEEKNKLYSIVDILGSIDATYSDYSEKMNIEMKKKKASSDVIGGNNNLEEEIYRMVRPKYLFIE